MQLLLIYAAVFILGLIVFERLTGTVAGRFSRGRSLNRRLQLLEGKESTLEAYKGMVRERALDYNRAGFKPVVVLRGLFAQSGMKVDVSKAAIYGAALTAALWLGLAYFSVDPLWRLVLIAATLLILPIVIIWRTRRARIQKYTEQLPNTLDVVNRSLMAGHPLPTAISLVSRELPDPIGSEFGMLSDELTYGTDLNVAMANMSDRVGAEDLKLLAIAMSVQRGTGGNFVEILENLANVLRERTILKAKVRALSAEGRITALIMSVFPAFLYLIIDFLAPDYFDPVWESGYANIVISVALVLMAIGNIIIFKMVNFEY